MTDIGSETRIAEVLKFVEPYRLTHLDQLRDAFNPSSIGIRQPNQYIAGRPTADERLST